MKIIIKRLARIESLLLLVLVMLVGGIYVPDFILEGQLSYRQRHSSLEDTINNQLLLFYEINGRFPKTMKGEGWSVYGSDITVQYYFPSGVPTHCPNGQEWIINHKEGQLEHHSSHY